MVMSLMSNGLCFGAMQSSQIPVVRPNKPGMPPKGGSNSF